MFFNQSFNLDIYRYVKKFRDDNPKMNYDKGKFITTRRMKSYALKTIFNTHDRTKPVYKQSSVEKYFRSLSKEKILGKNYTSKNKY